MFVNRTRKAVGLLSPLLAQVKATAAGKGARAQLGSLRWTRPVGMICSHFWLCPLCPQSCPSLSHEKVRFPEPKCLETDKLVFAMFSAYVSRFCYVSSCAIFHQCLIVLELGTEGEGWMLYLPKLVVWYTINIFFLWKNKTAHFLKNFPFLFGEYCCSPKIKFLKH